MKNSTNIHNIFGQSQSVVSEAVSSVDYEEKKQGTTNWNVPTIEDNQIGLTLLQQIEEKGIFYDVESRPNLTFNNEGEIIPTGKKTIYNASNNHPLSVQGEGYKIVENRQITTALFSAMQQSDIDLTNAFTRTRIDNDGQKMRLEIILPSTSFEVVVGDEVALSISAINSFDGSGNFTIKCSAYRFICANGMVSATPVIQMKQKHTQKLNIGKAAQIIINGVDQYQSDKATFIEQVKTSVDFQTVYESLAILNKIDLGLAPTYEEYQRVIRPTLKRKPIIENHMALWNKYARELGANQWALNNVFTHISTHGNSPEYSASVSINGRSDKEKLVYRAIQHMMSKAA